MLKRNTESNSINVADLIKAVCNNVDEISDMDVEALIQESKVSKLLLSEGHITLVSDLVRNASSLEVSIDDVISLMYPLIKKDEDNILDVLSLTSFQYEKLKESSSLFIAITYFKDIFSSISQEHEEESISMIVYLVNKFESIKSTVDKGFKEDADSYEAMQLSFGLSYNFKRIIDLLHKNLKEKGFNETKILYNSVKEKIDIIDFNKNLNEGVEGLNELIA